jgi:hypothetical protein
MQAGARRALVQFVPVSINPQTRPSRLMRSIPEYIRKSGITILRIYTMYRPLRVFLMLGISMILLGTIPGLRFIYLIHVGQRTGHVQSLILAAILIIVGFIVSLIGVVADLLSFNRKLLEELTYRVRRMEIAAAANRNGRGSHSDLGPSSKVEAHPESEGGLQR